MSTSRWDEVTILRKRVPPRDQGSKPGTGSSKDQNPIPGSQKKTIPPNKNKEALDPRFAAKIDNETEVLICGTHRFVTDISYNYIQ